MHEKIEPAMLLLNGREQRVHLLVVRHIARQHGHVGKRGSQLAHVLFEPLAGIREDKRGAFSRCRLCDRPRNRPLVGHADDEANFGCELCHREPALQKSLVLRRSGCLVPASPASASGALSVGSAGLAFTLPLAFGTESAAMTIRVAVTVSAAVMPAV